MAIGAPPNDHFTSRQTSTSPRGNQPSGLTAALKKSDSQDNTPTTTPPMEAPRPSLTVPETADMSRFENGTRPISMKGKSMNNRRESLAQSMGMGMSWGGVSVGSWIRDDMIMAGTSPFAFHQSPSYHSSSYLPKLEADFMRDFVCCGTMWKDLHALLTHYEETHAQQEPPQDQTAAQPQMPDQRAALASNTRMQIQHEAQQRAAQSGSQGGAVQPTTNKPGFSNTLQTIPDMDAVEDMEMDDFDGNNEATPPSNMFAQLSNHNSPSSQFASTAQPQVPQLNTNLMQSHQQYRNSTPNTPIVGRPAAAMQGANISSTLNPNPMQQFQDLHNPYRDTPDSSAPGTPGELDESIMAGIDDMSMQGNMFNGVHGFNNNFGFGTSNDMIDLCIDEPAKRLFQTDQPTSSQQSIHQRLGSGQYGPNSEIAKRIREQQIKAGLPDTMSNLLPNEEPKPYRCPVIGCDKSYRNANGLKYHKTHGHQNQRLQENGDGTFSILDPENNQPYPGTVGMEKEKPYKCDVCHKRYKNLNGLKYHKTHSPPCNPELAQQRLQQQQQQMQAQNSSAMSPSQQGASASISNLLPNQMNMSMGGLNFGVMTANAGNLS